MPFKRLSPVYAKRGAAAFLGVILCALLLIPIFAANAQERVLSSALLGDSTKSYFLGPYALVQKDPNSKVSPESLVESGGKVLAGKLQGTNQIHLGYDGVPTWIAIKFKGNSANDQWIIDLGRRAEGRMGYLKSVRVYEMLLTNPITVNEITTDHGKGVYNFTAAAGEEKFILFHMIPSAGKPNIVPMRVYSEKSYIEAVKVHAAFDMGYCVLMTVFGTFFLAMAFVGRKYSFSIFGAYFFYVIAFWLVYNNLSANSGPGVFGETMLFFALGHCILGIYMTKIFWNIEYGSYTEKYILYGLVWLDILATGLSILLPVGNGIVHIALYYGAALITMAMLCLMSLAQTRNPYIKDNFFFLCWFFPLIGLSVTVMSACRILPADPIYLNAFWYSLGLQGIFLFLALQKKFMEAMETERGPVGDTLNLHRLKATKESADNTRLLKVIQKEREMLAEFRNKEALRVEEMRNAKEVADEANRAKSAFLAVVSHEIRTPMSGVMGMVRLLLDSNITKQQRDYALTIKESGEAMLGLLNDILDFEKIQRGKMDLENISFDLHRLIQGVVTLMSGHAAEKQIHLSARMDEDTPRFVKGDSTRLRQVLLNLMGNGIKFTETGTVTLFIKCLNQTGLDGAPMKSERHMIYFAVQDSGIGIPADAQKNLFNPFAQASTSVARKFGGSGLGLAISKGLVETMGSTININSKDGEGSTFFFTLEMEKGISALHEQPSAPVPDAEKDQPVEPMRILVVDDNTITRKVVTGFLEQGNHEIVTSSSGEDALKKISQDAFDLIFMDIELPGIRGNEATRILRDNQDPVKANLPVIAITGNVSKEDMEQYLADGMTGVLPKPIEADKLKVVVREIARKRYEREIKAPGHHLFPDIRADKDFDSFAQPKPMETATDGVFNPDMLQSLKDAIGTKQLSELLDDLIIKTDEILGQMDAATKQGDFESLAARAHELKGMAGNFGLVEISALAEQAERKAKTNQMDGLGSLVGSLPDASMRAQTALKDWAAH